MFNCGHEEQLSSNFLHSLPSLSKLTWQPPDANSISKGLKYTIFFLLKSFSMVPNDNTLKKNKLLLYQI